MSDKSIRLLLIEDNPGDARLIREFLSEIRNNPYLLECADRLSKGLELLAGQDVDLVLLDLSLPDSEGFETFARVYAQVPDLPIVVVTGFNDEMLAVQAVQAGAQDYLVKGEIDSGMLSRAMRYGIERKKTEIALRKAREELEVRVEHRTADLAKANEELRSEIAERRRAEEALRESRQMLHLVLDTIPVRVFWKDLDSTYLGCNRQFALDAGLQSPEEIVGRNDFDIGWGQQAQLYRSDDRLLIETGVPRLGYEEPQATSSGKGIWFRKSKVPLVDVKGEIKGVLGTYEDITVHKRADEALLKAHDELERRVEERTAALEKANEELRQIPSKLIAVLEEERKRLASELHDSIGQTLAAVKFWVEMALKLRDEGNGKAALNHLEQFVPTLQRSIEETRSIYMGLRPSMLDNVGLLATLEWQRQECMKHYPQRHIELETRVAEGEIPESLKANIFRIAQEALNNIAKHSKAEWVDISLSKNGGEIELIVSDDGVGMDLDLISQTRTDRSLGLTSMQERAELTGGSFSIESTPGEGTTIRASWPIEAEDRVQYGGIA